MNPSAAGGDEASSTVSKLLASRSNLAAILAASAELNKTLVAVESRLSVGFETLSTASDAVGPLQSQSIAAKALHSRINRGVSPALSVLHSFSLVESLQRRLLSFPSNPTPPTKPNLSQLSNYVDCVERLNVAIGEVTDGCEPAIQKLQEAVEFLSRTKATDQLRIHRLRETLAAIKALYETEVDAMRYEGLLDEALLRLQDEFEGILQLIKHEGIGEMVEQQDRLLLVDMGDRLDSRRLGSDLEVDALRRISQILAANDCLDICIDIYVKVRYRRAAKALMRLNPTYLKTFTPKEIDKMEWESLESAITLWIDHFQLAVTVVFVAEKSLCNRVLSAIMDGAVWPECFVKIADKIMAVFFRFGEGVARSSKEPQKLFKLLDMFDTMDRIRTDFLTVFDGEPGNDICTRFRELQKLIVHAASKVFWEFGLQIEGLQDVIPPPADGSVPKIVRYAVNYLKCLTAGGYGVAMRHVLQTEQTWKAGFLSGPESDDESLLKEAVSNALDALQRNVKTKQGRYKDKVLPHVLAMNSYWYIYMRTRGSELARLVGDEEMKKKYKVAAEGAAYLYQEKAWGPLVRMLERKEDAVIGAAAASEKMEGFMREFDENLRRHRERYCVPDADLREQIREAVVNFMVPAYERFLDAYSGVMPRRSYLPSDSMKELLGQLFKGGGAAAEQDGGRRGMVEDVGKNNFRKRESQRRTGDQVGGSYGGSDASRLV